MEEKQTIIAGRKPVLDALTSEVLIDKILLQNGVQSDFEKEIQELVEGKNITIQMVPRETLNRLTKSNHQGVVAYTALIQYNDPSFLQEYIDQKEGNLLFLILDGITDVRNFGAIARSAECFGVDAIIISQNKQARLNEEAIKTSAGALLKIPLVRAKNLSEAFEILKSNEVKIVAGTLSSDRKLADISFEGSAAIILGAEDKGVSKESLKWAEERFVIPQKGRTQSLNVSVAAGVILYEARRSFFA